jgi:hypothetical protein
MKRAAGIVGLALLGQVLAGNGHAAAAQVAKTAYPAMASLARYLPADARAEIALARSAAPASISDSADVMVLGPRGYIVAVKGRNGFVCIVGRSWAMATTDPEFWNPAVRAPLCLNAAAARSYLPIYLMKTRLVLAGRSPTEVAQTVASAFASKQLPPLAPGAMCYMMSKQQYLNDDGKRWHPHVMFYQPGASAASWGGNFAASPVLASNDPQEHLTVFMVVVNRWSDGTPDQRAME